MIIFENRQIYNIQFRLYVWVQEYIYVNLIVIDREVMMYLKESWVSRFMGVVGGKKEKGRNDYILILMKLKKYLKKESNREWEIEFNSN